MGDGDEGLSAPQIAKQIDASLQRLQTDYVAQYQAHRFNTSVAIKTSTRLSLRAKPGLGFSEWTPEQIPGASLHCLAASHTGREGRGWRGTSWTSRRSDR